MQNPSPMKPLPYDGLRTFDMVVDNFPVQETPLLQVDIGGGIATAALGPVFTAASSPAEVFKMAYQGDLFGTAGNYMEG